MEFRKMMIALACGHNIFLFGPGGTGKTYTIRKIHSELSSSSKIAVLAPTGIAALNLELNAQTINRFFQIPPCDTSKMNSSDIRRVLNQIKRKKNPELGQIKFLIIDEISMVGQFLLYMMDSLLRYYNDPNEPFGGVQCIFSGDFYQLPPVKDDWCFKTKIWNSLKLYIFEFNEPKRYLNIETFEFLQRVRKDQLLESDIELLESRKLAYDNKEYKKRNITPIQLYSDNNSVNNYNNRKLNKLPGVVWTFNAIDKCEYHITGLSGKNKQIDNEYKRSVQDLHSEIKKIQNDICPQTINIKIGAHVMFCRNYDPNNKLVNGTLAIVTNIQNSFIEIQVENGNIYQIFPKMFSVETRNYTASRKQYPLKLAWATTIHKSQGLTLDNVVVDISRVCNPGQAYVALSRCKDINTLYIRGNIDICKIWADHNVLMLFN